MAATAEPSNQEPPSESDEAWAREEGKRADLGSRAARGGVAVGASQAVSIGLNLIAFPILSRLLSPEDIGLVAMASIVTSLANAFVDSGLGIAAIQAPTLSRQQASNLFWCNIALGFVLALSCVAGAPLAAWVFDDPRIETVILVSAVAVALAGLSLQHLALLRRRLCFQAVAVIAITAAAASQVAAVGYAWWFESYWALVVRALVAGGVTVTGAWWFCRWVPEPPRRGAGTRGLAAFGSKVLASRLVYQASAYADTATLGVVTTPEIVGLYDRVLQLLLAPIRKISGPLSGVMVPVLSRTADEPERYRTAFLSVMVLLVAMLAPVAGVILGAPDWVVRVAMGPGWEDAASLFRIVGVGLTLTPLFNATNWLFTSQARAGELVVWQTIDAAWRLVLLAIGACWGVTGVVWAVVARLLTMPHAFYWRLGVGGPVGLRDYAGLEAAALGVTAACGLASYTVRGRLEELGNPYLGLAVVCFVAVFVSVSVMAATPPLRRSALQALRLLRRPKAA